jgi:hypothetical protein
MKHDTAPSPLVSMPETHHVQAVLQAQSHALQTQASRRGRPTQLSWMHLCLGVLVCALSGWRSQLDLRRLLCTDGFWNWPAIPMLSDQAIYNRLDRAATHMHTLFELISQSLRQRLAPWQDRSLAPFATQVLALDESELDKVGAWLPPLRGLGTQDARLRGGRLSALFDIRLQQWWRVDLLEEAGVNCKVQARRSIQELQAGVLLLFDRGYFSFEWFDELTERGIFWISRYANHASYQVKHICYQGDGILDAIVWLGTYRADQALQPVRLLRFWYRGKAYTYLTNVYDPRQLSAGDIMRLYARRWDIELAFRVMFDHLHLNHLWSAKWSVIQVQIWAVLLLAQIFHGLQYEIARQAGVQQDDVSIDLLVQMTARWQPGGTDVVDLVVRVGRELGVIRPSSRTKWTIPEVDPCWVDPPPADVLKPREQARHAHRNCQPHSHTVRSQKQGKPQRATIVKKKPAAQHQPMDSEVQCQKPSQVSVVNAILSGPRVRLSNGRLVLCS